MTRWHARLLVAALVVGFSTVEARQDTAVEITARDGKVTGRLTTPRAATGKMPVVVFVSGADEFTAGGFRSLANALMADGIASLRYERRAPSAAKETDPGFESEVADTAAWVSFLRNDIRFSTITVIGDPAGASIAEIAARVARADNFASIAEANVPAVTKAVRDLDLPGVFHPRRNTGQRGSVRDTTIAVIDGSRIAIEYGRPSKRNRVIWGGLVPWGRVWMPGADESSTLTTNDTLVFSALVVPKGDYTIYTQPAADSFTLIINGQTGQFHTVYPAERDLGRVPMTQEKVEPTAERLTFAIEPQASGGGVLKLIWDDRAYLAPFVVKR